MILTESDVDAIIAEQSMPLAVVRLLLESYGCDDDDDRELTASLLADVTGLTLPQALRLVNATLDATEADE